MKVFIVTNGEYSDYHICSVFENRKDAEIYVASKFVPNRYCWACDNYMIEEYDTGEIKIETNDDRIVHVYEYFSNQIYSEPVSGMTALKSLINPNYDGAVTIDSKTDWGGGTVIVLRIVLENMDDERAFKIFLERKAKILAYFNEIV